jgi:hypothetical protein
MKLQQFEVLVLLLSWALASVAENKELSIISFHKWLNFTLAKILVFFTSNNFKHVNHNNLERRILIEANAIITTAMIGMIQINRKFL